MASDLELKDVEGFFRRYTRRVGQLESLRYQDFKSDFSRIAAAIQSMKRLGKELERAKAPEFNIFTILGMSDSEVRTHSALLADLLNPKGKHGQGELFLALFFGLPSVGLTKSEDLDGWVVHRDKVTAFGNMDIFLGASRLKQCIIIENKIDARDQPGQMSRYYRWLKASPYNVETSRLFYLTREGRSPSDGALVSEGRVDVEAASFIRLLSYKLDIVPFLKIAIEQITAVKVRETLSQYCYLFQTQID